MKHQPLEGKLAGEARTKPRVDLNRDAKLEIQGGTVPVKALDISEGGAQVLLPQGITPAAAERVTLLFGGGVPDSDGVVRRVVDNAATPGQFTIGVQFDVPIDPSAVLP